MIPIMIGLVVVGRLGPPPVWSGLAIGPAVLLAFAWLKRLARAPTLTIGDDGLVYVAGRKQRVIPRAEIVAIEHVAQGMPIYVRTRDGGVLAISGGATDVGRRAAASRLALERLFGAGSPREAESGAVFARGARTVAEWREHLRGLFAREGYRVAGATVDEAAAVLRSPSASPDERIGAALALRDAGEPASRIRVAADGLVDPRVRVALEAIADDAPEAIVVEKASRRAAR
jgi:hypothetical protein